MVPFNLQSIISSVITGVLYVIRTCSRRTVILEGIGPNEANIQKAEHVLDMLIIKLMAKSQPCYRSEELLHISFCFSSGCRLQLVFADKGLLEV